MRVIKASSILTDGTYLGKTTLVLFCNLLQGREINQTHLMDVCLFARNQLPSIPAISHISDHISITWAQSTADVSLITALTCIFVSVHLVQRTCSYLVPTFWCKVLAKYDLFNHLQQVMLLPRYMAAYVLPVLCWHLAAESAGGLASPCWRWQVQKGSIWMKSRAATNDCFHFVLFICLID